MVDTFLLKILFIKYLNGIKIPEFPKRLFVGFAQQSVNTFISLLLTILCGSAWIKGKCFLNKSWWVMPELVNKYSKPIQYKNICAACSRWPSLGRGVALNDLQSPFQPQLFCEYILVFWKNEMDLFINLILHPMRFINRNLVRQMSWHKKL